MGLDHGETIPHPLQRGVEIGGHLPGVLGRKLGADGVLLAPDDDPDRVLRRGHAALPPPCCSRNESRPARTGAAPWQRRSAAERLILGLQLDHPLAGLGELGPGQHAAIGAGLLQLAFRLQCSPAPAGQLLGQVTDHLLQVAQRLLVGPFVSSMTRSFSAACRARIAALDAELAGQARQASASRLRRLRRRAASGPAPGR